VWLGEVPEGVSEASDLDSVTVLLDGDQVVGVNVLQVRVTVEHVWLWETVRLPGEYVRVTVGGVGVGVPVGVEVGDIVNDKVFDRDSDGEPVGDAVGREGVAVQVTV